MPVLTALEIADDPAAWREAGFAVAADGTTTIGSVAIRLAPQEGRKSITGWSFDAIDATEVEGIPTAVEPPPSTTTEHPNGTLAIDHVVVLSPDVDRTIEAFTALGLEAKRERKTDSYGAPMRQVFFRSGEVILELIGGQEKHGDGPCGFFGVALTVADIDATKAQLGEHLGDPKDAVQPGRRIATVRKTLGLTTPVAVMSPEPR
jgi:catechol 2,3-dioxygenase-like lactoylglutathione lyase family enzyme